MIRRLALPVVAVTLGVLLALLAFLQYRWLGQVSDGERQRMRTTLEARARDFAAEFDRELGKAAAAFALPAGSGPETGQPQPLAPALAERWDRWQASGADTKLVREVFVVDRSTPQIALRRFDPSSRTLVAAEWPEALRPTRDRWVAEFAGATAAPAQLQHLPTRVFIDDLSEVPALVVPNQPDILTFDPGAVRAARTSVPFDVAVAGPAAGPGPGPSPGTAAGRVTAPEAAPGVGQVFSTRVLVQQANAPVTVLWLDLDEIRRVLLPSLVKRYFASDDVFDYQVTALLRRDPKTVFFETDHAASDRSRRAAGSTLGDATVPMFRLRLAEIFSPAPADGAGGPRQRPVEAPGAVAGGTAAAWTRQDSPAQGRQGQIVMRFEATHTPTSRTNAVFALGDASGGWLLRLVHRAGSLDAAVERLRRRNLAISSTILGLLAVSLGFVLVSTRRAQRLAAQQVEFVASVSHELRTPLSVIRSAGENLADGVVDSPDHVRRYGALVAEEGRKLGAMVEQVMEYAGMQSDQPRWMKAPVDPRAVVDEAVAGARRLPEARNASIEVEVDEGLAPLDGDRAALVRAVQNLVENALKYGGGKAGGGEAGRPWVSVRVTEERSPHDAAARPKPRAAPRPASGRPEQGRTGAGPRSIVIEVSDRGPGIDAAERRRIFEPFVRGRAAAAARVPGNGLGLSIVRRVVEGHGGRVEVNSLPGGGACFTIRLPRRSTEL